MGQCIEWTGPTRAGYGLAYVDGRRVSVHRLAWEQANGSIPDGMKVCHRCDNPSCYNVDHLFLGTQRDNILDAVAKGRWASQKVTECPQGHPYSPENTYVAPRGDRQCRVCRREAVRRYSQKKVS
jgi:hypothetical protein